MNKVDSLVNASQCCGLVSSGHNSNWLGVRVGEVVEGGSDGYDLFFSRFSEQF